MFLQTSSYVRSLFGLFSLFPYDLKLEVWFTRFEYSISSSLLQTNLGKALQHELAQAAHEGVCQLVEQSDGELSAFEKAAAMKVTASKKAEALTRKMSKLVCVANPELTDGWLKEVCLITYASFFILKYIH